VAFHLNNYTKANYTNVIIRGMFAIGDEKREEIRYATCGPAISYPRGFVLQLSRGIEADIFSGMMLPGINRNSTSHDRSVAD